MLDKNKIKSFFRVNKRFLPIKLHFALFNAGTACVQLTMPVYAKSLKFSSFVVGTIYTILPLLGLIIKPLFGIIADKYKKHRTVLIGWELITLLTYFCLQYIPSPSVPIDTNGAMSKYYSVSPISACYYLDEQPYLLAESGRCTWNCPLNEEFSVKWNLTSYSNSLYPTSELKTTCLPIPEIKNFNVSKSECARYCTKGAQLKDADDTNDDDENALSDADTFVTWQFWIFLLLLIGSWGGTAVIMTLTDTICVETCGDLYGRQRMWASFAWGTFCIFNGLLIDAFSTEGEEKNYTPAFYLMLGPLVIDVVLSYFLEINLPEQSEQFATDAFKVIKKPKTLLFMLWCGMVGTSFGMQWNFLFWYLEDLALASTGDTTSVVKTLEGIASAFQTILGEFPAFFFSGWIIEKLGHGHSMSLIFLAIGIRFCLYSILKDPWWTLPIELLQNHYGLFYSTMTSYASSIALPGTEATIQSIICAVCEGIGVAVGSFLGGVFYDTYGGAVAFQIFGVTYLVIVVINEILELSFKMWDKRHPEKAIAEADDITNNRSNSNRLSLSRIDE